MSTLWIAIGLLAVVNIVFKGIGPALLGGRQLPAPVTRVIALLAATLLAALVVVQVAGNGWSSLDWTLVVGLGVVALARLLLRAPELVAILAGVLVTALLRLLT